MTAQLEHGIERFRRRAVREAGGQFVSPLLKLVLQVRQRLRRVSPLSGRLRRSADRRYRTTAAGFVGAPSTAALRRAL